MADRTDTEYLKEHMESLKADVWKLGDKEITNQELINAIEYTLNKRREQVVLSRFDSLTSDQLLAYIKVLSGKSV